MTAETGMNVKGKLKTVSRLYSLAGTAQDLITRDARSRAEVDALLMALQAFKEGRLGAIFFRATHKLEGEELLKALSVPIESIPLSKNDKKYLRDRGIKFLGELYYVVFDRRSRLSRERGEKIFEELALHLAVPMELDPLTVGWQPPYWSDPHFIATLNQPVIDCFGETKPKNTCYDQYDQSLSCGGPQSMTIARMLHRLSVHYMGQYLKFDREPKSGKQGNPSNAWSTGKLEDRRKELGGTSTLLWAAALVPPNWQPPEKVPQAWLVEQARMLEEQTVWEAEQSENNRRQREWRKYHDEQARRRERWLCGDPVIDDPAELTEHLASTPELFEWPANEAESLQKAGIVLIGQLVQLTDSQLRFLKVDPGIVSRELRELDLYLYMRLVDPEGRFTLPDGLRDNTDSKTLELSCNDNLFRRVDELHLSVRTLNRLERIEYIGQLVQYAEAELLRMSTGRKSLREIKNVLNELGLGLDMTLPEELREKFKKPSK